MRSFVSCFQQSENLFARDFAAGKNGGCKTDCNSVLIQKEKHFTSVIGDEVEATTEALSGALLALSTSYFMTRTRRAGPNPRYFQLPGRI